MVVYPWLQGFDDGLAGDAGKCTWQCVTCLDMGVQLHLNEGGIVYCAHILSNTPPYTAAARHTCAQLHRGMQLIVIVLFPADCLASTIARIVSAQVTTSIKFTEPVQD